MIRHFQKKRFYIGLLGLLVAFLLLNCLSLPFWKGTGKFLIGVNAQQPSETTNPNPFGIIISTPAADGSISHTVKEGEFLIPIAQAYGITLDELLALNGLTADSIIQPGQILIIRTATTPLPALTSGTVLAPTATLRPSFTPKPTLTPYYTATPTITPTPGPSIFTRVFTGNARYVGYGLLALIVLGVILLVISSRRIR